MYLRSNKSNNNIFTYFGYNVGWPIITYLFIVIARTVNSDTASKPYLSNGNNWQRRCPCLHALCQNVDAASGRLKQHDIKSETLRFMINTAVAFLTCKNKL